MSQSYSGTRGEPFGEVAARSDSLIGHVDKNITSTEESIGHEGEAREGAVENANDRNRVASTVGVVTNDVAGGIGDIVGFGANTVGFGQKQTRNFDND